VPRGKWLGVFIYGVIVASLTMVAILLGGPEDDVSIGQGAVLLLLLGLSFPWSVPAYFSDLTNPQLAVVAALLALLNLGLFLVLLGRISARRGPGYSGSGA
jgi:hypothetical protein